MIKQVVHHEALNHLSEDGCKKSEKKSNSLQNKRVKTMNI